MNSDDWRKLQARHGRSSWPCDLPELQRAADVSIALEERLHGVMPSSSDEEDYEDESDGATSIRVTTAQTSQMESKLKEPGGRPTAPSVHPCRWKFSKRPTPAVAAGSQDRLPAQVPAKKDARLTQQDSDTQRKQIAVGRDLLQAGIGLLKHKKQTRATSSAERFSGCHELRRRRRRGHLRWRRI